MKNLAVWLAAILVLSLMGCTTLEKTAYRTVVGAKAYLDSEKKQHPECAVTPLVGGCQYLVRATFAKDLLIDALEVYCSGPAFEKGGACQPPTKDRGTAEVKLQAAINVYNQAAKDLKGVLR